MSKLTRFLVAAVAVSLLSAISHADNTFETGLKIGSQAPELNAIDSQGQPQTLKSLSAEKGLVLVFFRSADWCPYCKRHLIEMKDWVKPLEEKGYKVAAISYDNKAILAEFKKEKDIPYPLLSDNNVATVKAYSVLNTNYAPKDDNYGIPFPGAYIISNEGVVTYKYFYTGYKKRVKLNTLLDALKH